MSVGAGARRTIQTLQEARRQENGDSLAVDKAAASVAAVQSRRFGGDNMVAGNGGCSGEKLSRSGCQVSRRQDWKT